MPAKALDQVLAAVKHFQQASQPFPKPVAVAVAPGEKSPPAQDGLSPQLWLLCRVQVPVMLAACHKLTHCMLSMIAGHLPYDLTYDKQITCGTPWHTGNKTLPLSASVVSEGPSQHLTTNVVHRL